MSKRSVTKTKRICQVEGCNNKHKSKGLCNKHYQQMQKHGKITPFTRMSPNQYEFVGKEVHVYLRNNSNDIVGTVFVDKDDFYKIKEFKWSLHSTGCARAKIEGRDVRMHHVLLDFEYKYSGIEVDHINRNPLDNRKKNLRLVPHYINALNRDLQNNNTSGYRGVVADRSRKKWTAAIKVRGHSYHLGSFVNKEDAAIAYNEAALKYNGKDACLNQVCANNIDNS